MRKKMAQMQKRSGLFLDIIYGGERHLWGKTSSMRGMSSMRGTSSMGGDVIYGGVRHLWRKTSSMRGTSSMREGHLWIAQLGPTRAHFTNRMMKTSPMQRGAVRRIESLSDIQRQGYGSQLQVPGFAHELRPKQVMRLGLHQLEPGALIDAARRSQNAVRPQRNLAIAGLAG